MGLEQLASTREAGDAVRRELALAPSCPPAAVRAELLRATVWSLAAPASSAHVNRVLGAALPAARLIDAERRASDEVLRADLREMLSSLDDAGDLLQLSGGYWGPATTRVVHMPDAKGALLVGGAPSSVLPIERARIEHHGPFRHLRDGPRDLGIELPVEEFEAWAKLPSTSLSDFARDVFDSLERHAYAPTTPDSFEFYVPSSPPASRAAPQWKRWSTSADDAKVTLLARRTRVYGAREYRLVDVSSGHITSICDLQATDVRRLMYALDLAANNPVRARLVVVDGEREWVLTTELPRPEQRTFAALGSLTIPEDRPWERRWRFTRNEVLALDMLRALGIIVDNGTRGDR